MNDVQRDAMRYRWLRREPEKEEPMDIDWPWCVHIEFQHRVPTMVGLCGSELDAAIDAAMAVAQTQEVERG
uniref:hypothetical protein n=1 Tax=Xanthomonas albilineans TaxID=29447 RepID=UPI0027DC0516|nr:hypothetical protein [Xanthomonas albilineans]